ncbi:MAG TPA: FapA family protein, partial [Bacillota bacterium]|nr:FapA family protein [Bacillota bacterium]
NMELVAKKLEKERKSLEQVDLNIGLIAKIAKKGYLPENKKMLLKKCVDLKAQLEENIKQHEALLKDMKEQFNTISRGRVKVQNVVYPGTVITIGPSTYHVKDQVEFATFHRTGGEIKIGSFDE